MTSKSNKFKKTGLILSVFVILFMIFSPVTAHASPNVNEITIDKQEVIDLHDSSGNVVAYYYQLNPSGHVILRSDNGEMIEYSTNDNNYFADSTAYYYYAGPLQYYKQDVTLRAGYIKHIVSGEVIALTELSPLTRGPEADASGTLNINNFLSIELNAVGSDSTSYSTAKYHYNPDGRCGAAAGAIVLKYYDQHKSGSYIPSSLDSSDGKVLINKLVSIMGTGTTFTELKNGLSTYLKQYYKPITVRSTTYSWGDRVKTIIGKNFPCILRISSHPTYHEHWVVVTGYNFTSANTGTYTVNNGWGDTGVKINSSYTRGCIDLG